MKKKICVVFTGGTIGSGTDGTTVALNTGSRKMLIDSYVKAYGKDITFDELSPINVLSENIQPEDLKILYDCVKGIDFSAYDGIIITHGTDTLCFTVNLFGQLFCNSTLPIVFVSALYPLSDPHSNGLTNFAGAIDFIEKGNLRGVYCSFANDGENCKIHLASRLTYPDEINGFYHSAAGAHIAEIIDREVVINHSPLLPTPEMINANDSQPFPFTLSSNIMLVTMRSLLLFTVYDFSKIKPQAVIVELSHSGTVCTAGDELNFKKFADYCEECGVPLIIAPIMSRARIYDSMKELPESVMSCFDQTMEVTLVKVMCALGAGLKADAYFERNAAFEKIYFPYNN